MTTKYGDTLGSILIGGMLALALSGIIFCQTIAFFSKRTKDSFFFKSVIAVLWCLDVFDSACIIHLLYSYLVINFTNPGYMAHTTWSLSLHSIEICINNAIIHATFIWKYYQLSPNIPWTVVMAAFSVTGFLLSVILTLKVLFALSFAEVYRLRPLYYAAGTGNICSDLSIFLGMARLFHRSKTGFRSTDSILSNLVLFFINAGFLLAIDAALGVIALAALPGTWYFLAARLLWGKLFLIPYLAMINFREHFRSRSDFSMPFSNLFRSRGNTTHMRSCSKEEKMTQGRALSICLQTSVQDRVDDGFAVTPEKIPIPDSHV